MKNGIAWFGCRLVAVLACIPGPAVHAYNLSNDKWPDPETTFYVDLPGANDLWNTSFEDAMAQWSSDTVFNYLIVRDQFRNPCNSPSAFPPARNGVDFSSTNCGNSWGSGVLASASSYFSNGVRIQAGIVFNDNHSWDVYSGPWQSSPDFRRVAVHELGHALGLDHENVQPSIMRPIISGIENPTADDIAGVLAQYGPSQEPDTDGDGVLNGNDNCTLLANQTQCDSDNDGYGNRCDADFGNPAPGNGTTNSQDYVLFRAQLGQPSVAPTYNKADINCNGVVNAQDYVLFRGLLGAAPGPSGMVP